MYDFKKKRYADIIITKCYLKNQVLNKLIITKTIYGTCKIKKCFNPTKI